MANKTEEGVDIQMKRIDQFLETPFTNNHFPILLTFVACSQGAFPYTTTTSFESKWLPMC